MTAAVPILLLLLAAPGEGERAPAREPASGPASPALLVLHRGEVVTLLKVDRVAAARSDESPLEVVYWAGADPALLANAPGRKQAIGQAERVFQAFRVWSATKAIYRVRVSAMAGLPGAPGRALVLEWNQFGPGRWARERTTLHDVELPRFAATDGAGARDRRAEAGALASAEAFLRKCDAGNGREAWSSASVFRSSRTAEQFQAFLDMLARITGRVASRRRLFSMYPASRTREGTVVQVRFEGVADGGEGVEDVTVRLEEGDAWRVVRYEPRFPVPADRGVPLAPGGREGAAGDRAPAP